MRVSVKYNGYRCSVLAARDRDNALAAVFRPDRHRLLDALAWPGCFDRDYDRHSNRFGSGRLCRVHAAIAGEAGVPPLLFCHQIWPLFIAYHQLLLFFFHPWPLLCIAW